VNGFCCGISGSIQCGNRIVFPKNLVRNDLANTVSAIATASNTVVATIDVGTYPIAFGIFILPRFAGTLSR
jgi:YVTN family beta-propeller protein